MEKMDLTSNKYFVAIVLIAIAIHDTQGKSYSNAISNELVVVASMAAKDKNNTDDATLLVTKEPKFFDEFECK